MNVFNRLIAILVLIALLLLGAVIGAMPFMALDTARGALDWAALALRQTQEARPALFVVGQVAVVVASLAIFGFLLWLEMRRPYSGSAPLSLEGEAQADVTLDSVVQRLNWHLAQLADVTTARARVRGRGRLVDVEIEIETAPVVEVPMKTEEVVAVAREVVEERMGLHLGKINVRMRHAPFASRPA